MLTFDSAQLTFWVTQCYWPMVRLLALFSTAPLFNEKQIPRKVKVGIALMITLLITPNLPTVTVPLFSVAAFWLTLQQIIIGAAIGVTMQFAFGTVRLAGEVIGAQMGLSFATFVDPAGPNMPILARILNVLAMLLFITLDGHLWLLSLLAESFHSLPVAEGVFSRMGFLELAKAGTMIFTSGMMLALPMIILLLTVSVSLGLLNRVTPQLSIFVIGFPLSLTIGIFAMGLILPLFAPYCERLFSEFFNLIGHGLMMMKP